jgi:hypothetical protein
MSMGRLLLSFEAGAGPVGSRRALARELSSGYDLVDVDERLAALTRQRKDAKTAGRSVPLL